MSQQSHSAGGDAAQSPLGKPVAYCEHYAPGLLFPIPRQAKRAELGIREGTLPFGGEDLWHAYELSWLNPRGKPVVALGEFRVPADTPRLVESKSLNLYLNSFNQTRFESIEAVCRTIECDLSAAAGGHVRVTLTDLCERPRREIGEPPGTLLDTLDVAVDRYQPAPELLSSDVGSQVAETLHSHLLKSNCLVTGQPDWGCVVLSYRGPAIAHEGLLRYIVSFRQHNEFHEQCVERIFIDVTTRCRPEALAVWALYTRRGGLDINPFRSSGHFPVPPDLAEVRQ
jgi:7-cyano-7-deazaguanine reductase